MGVHQNNQLHAGATAIQSAEQRTMMVGRRVVRSEPCLPVTERDLRKRKLHIFILNVILPLIVGLAFKIKYHHDWFEMFIGSELHSTISFEETRRSGWSLVLGWFES